MYNFKTLYYLNQLGITPWVSRGSMNNQDEIIQANQLILLCSKPLVPKAQILLQSMVNCIQRLDIPALLITIGPDELNQEILKKKLSQKNIFALLILGMEFIPFLKDLNLTCPVFYHPKPEFLLQPPNSKKMVFKDLSAIQSLVRI